MSEANERNETKKSLAKPDYSCILCNMCGKPFTEFDFCMGDNRYDIFINYPSRHDCKRVQLNLCSDCFDRVLDLIVPLCKIGPVVDNDWLEHCVSNENGQMIIHKDWGPGGEGYIRMKGFLKSVSDQKDS